jgi:hypothetical protein
MPNDPVRTAQRSRKADELILDGLTVNFDTRFERKKHLLAALTAAAVPLDVLTSIALHDLANGLADFLETFCRECDVP